MVANFGIKFRIGILTFWILISALTDVLGEEETFQTLDFYLLKNDVSYLENQKVRIRGFLFKKANQWVLAEEPNLKTCCIGSKEKADRQLLLDGMFDENFINHVIEVEGIFKRAEGPFKYEIRDARFVNASKRRLGLIVAFCIFCGLIVFVYYRR